MSELWEDKNIISGIAQNTFTKKHTNTITSETKYTNIRDYLKGWLPEEEEKIF